MLASGCSATGVYTLFTGGGEHRLEPQRNDAEELLAIDGAGRSWSVESVATATGWSLDSVQGQDWNSRVVADGHLYVLDGLGLRIGRPDDGREWLLDPSLVGEFSARAFAVDGESFHVVLASESEQRLLHFDGRAWWLEELGELGELDLVDPTWIREIGVAAGRAHLLRRAGDAGSQLWTQVAGDWTMRAHGRIAGFALDGDARLWWTTDSSQWESAGDDGQPTIQSEDGCRIELGADARALALAGGERIHVLYFRGEDLAVVGTVGDACELEEGVVGTIPKSRRIWHFEGAFMGEAAGSQVMVDLPFVGSGHPNPERATPADFFGW